MNDMQLETRMTNPLFNSNKLKLGVFGLNGASITASKLPERYVASWDEARPIFEAADRAGLEAIVPYARWLPFGPAGHVSGRVLDPACYAAAASALTRHSAVMATVHTPIFHPMVVAKQGATIDQISAGRFGLNVVCGWMTPEISMFGPRMKTHDDRYAQADEWMTIVKRAWVEEQPFDFDGSYIQALGAYSDPKPVQRPYPPVMNAGGSEKGREFAAKHADLVFVMITTNDLTEVKRQVDTYRQLAWDRHRRQIQVWSYASVVQRDSLKEAEDYVDLAINQHGDWEQVDTFIKYQMEGAKTMPPDVLQKMRFSIAAGGGGVPLLGTAEQIADKLQQLSQCGLDGLLLAWMDPVTGLTSFTRKVLPLLEQQGLRAAHRAP